MAQKTENAIEEERLNLYQKLAKIRAMSDVIRKNKKGYNYYYADMTEVLAHVTAGMKKYGVSLVPSINKESATIEQTVSVNTKFDKQGNAYDQTVSEMTVKADMVFTWVNDENPDERIEVPWVLTGAQADPSQAFGSAVTYCTRYFLISYFQIATEQNDVDAYRSKQKEVAESEDKAIADAIIAQFDTTVKTFLSSHDDKKEEVQDFISKYAKKGNYFSIHDPVLASKLQKDFEAKYTKKPTNKGE